MACYQPIPAHREAAGMVYYSKSPTHWLACQVCIGCREDQSRTWALRLQHETRYHSHTKFLTLTYDDENLPDGLDKRELQLFWKKLRKQSRNTLRYFACGEYGDRTQRPHYHSVVYGLEDFEDTTRRDSENDQSPTLDKIWGNGDVTISEATPGRMAYVTGYVLKKAGYRKQVYCDEDGVELEPPFRVMSRGLGMAWVHHFAQDLRNGHANVPNDSGIKAGIPRYYRDYIKRYWPGLDLQIQTKLDERRATLPEPDPARLRAAQYIKEQLIKNKKAMKAL